MNVVDSLVVTLGLDPSNFTKGQKQAAEALLKTQNQASRTAKEMQADGAKAAEFFGAIKTEFLGLIGVLLGSKGIEAFVRDQTKSLADLGREAKNIGVSIPVLAAFRNAVELNGGSAEAATASFRSLTDQMEHLKVYGNSPLMPFLRITSAKSESVDSGVTDTTCLVMISLAFMTPPNLSMRCAEPCCKRLVRHPRCSCRRHM